MSEGHYVVFREADDGEVTREWVDQCKGRTAFGPYETMEEALDEATRRECERRVSTTPNELATDRRVWRAVRVWS